MIKKNPSLARWPGTPGYCIVWSRSKTVCKLPLTAIRCRYAVCRLQYLASVSYDVQHNNTRIFLVKTCVNKGLLFHHQTSH